MEIESEKREVQETLRVQVANLAVDIAGKIILKIWINRHTAI
jgi:F-type H+-transporting ATPase subunit b